MFWNRPATKLKQFDWNQARNGIVKVGTGRGFAVGAFVATTASNLPYLPLFRPFNADAVVEYRRIIGPLSGDDLPASALCLSVEIISNVAILRELEPEFWDPPPNYTYDDDGYAIESWSTFSGWDNRFRIGAPYRSSIIGAETLQEAWIFSLEGEWVKCSANNFGNGLTLEGVPFEIDGRLSGSPILDESGAVFGIISAPTEADDREEWAAIHVHAEQVLAGWAPP